MSQQGIQRRLDIVAKLHDLVRAKGNQAKAAKELGISSVYLGEILRGTRTPGPRVLKALGVSREVTYREE